MYMSREIMHCKPGKAKDMVEKFKKMSKIFVDLGHKPIRIYTDLAGDNYWTVIAEQEVERLDDFAEISRQTMTHKDFADAMAGYHELVQNGRRELYKVEHP